MRPALLTGDSLLDCLSHRVRAAPDTTVCFPDTGERITARDVDEASLRSAHALLGRGVRPGDVVGLLLPTDAQFLTVFLGAQRAGAAVSVLPLPAGFADPVMAARRIARVLHTAGIRHLVLADAYAPFGTLLRDLMPGLVLHDPAAAASGSAAALPAADPEALSIVQFTSGSTSLPKGVMLSQSTVAAGLHSLVDSAGFTQDDVYVQWVPTFHDMGLIGLLCHFLNGSEVHVFPPASFLRRPAALLGYFAEHRGTVFSGPNFSYDHLLDAVSEEQVRALDLSAWRFAFNGAEPVSAATTARFTGLLAPAGVRDGVMYPVYGMAEATLGITFPVPGSAVRTLSVDRDLLAEQDRAVPVGPGARGAKQVVSVGRPVAGIRLRLVADGGRVCAPGEQGEIQVRGPGVTSGYYGDPRATADAFDGPWLRTGDLGFQDDGHLYVTGRKKDMVIVRGQNFFPDDIEAVARDVPGVHRRHCVAFSDTDAETGGEVVRVVVEAKAPGAAGEKNLMRAVAARVESELDFTDVRVHVVTPRWLPRTTSGKWQRALARRQIAKLLDTAPDDSGAPLPGSPTDDRMGTRP